MNWGALPADRLRVVADALGNKRLRFLSLGRLTFIWEAAEPKGVTHIPGCNDLCNGDTHYLHGGGDA